jgi:hypothetical protein
MQANPTNAKPILTQAQYNALYNAPLLMEMNLDNYSAIFNIFRRTRPWFERECNAHELHPAIHSLIDSLYYKYRATPLTPYVKDWREILLEFPHVSTEDPTKIAYTRDDNSGERDIQTRTSLGKYIKRHCPSAPDHIIRNFTALHDVASGQIKLLHTTQQMIHAVQSGPSSCMQDDDFEEWDHHPYEVYAPEFGWHMAVRYVDGTIMGRCLLNDNNNHKTYVRSYRRADGHSPTDEAIEAWLSTQGYTKKCDWDDGLRLKHLTHNGDIIMAYLDGGTKAVDDCGGGVFKISSDGEYEADNSNGYLGDQVGRAECEYCGDRYHNDDMYWVNRREDTQVCGDCLSSNYTYVVGYQGCNYHVEESRVVHCESDGEDYDCEYIDDHGIVEAEDGNYYHRDDVWYCESRSEFYVTDDVEPVMVDGECVHPDDYEEEEQEEEDTTETE